MVGPSPARRVSAKVSARGLRAQAVAASAAAPAANDGGSRRARSAGRSGNRISGPPGRCGRCGAPLQLVAEQAAQVVEDAGLDRRVQPVAAVVDPDPVQLEAGGGPAGPGARSSTTTRWPARAVR